MPTLDDLAARLPPGAVVTDPARLLQARSDSSPRSLLRAVRGDPVELPSAVVRPSSTEDVVEALRWAAAAGTPVVARGGGSGVCGAVEAARGWLVLDLAARMNRVLSVDEVSLAAHVEAGIRGDLLEAALELHGLTTGHYPQSIGISTVGGWIAASSAGQASTGYGAVEDLVLGLKAVLADGRVLNLRPVPRSAAGPDLRRLLVGSEGTLAVITEAHLSCAPRPSGWRWESFGFASFEACMAGLRAVARTESGAAVLRGYDEVDAMLSFGPAGHVAGSAAVVGMSADLPGVDERLRAVTEAAEAAGAERLGPAYGERWWTHRNDAVELYGRIMGPERSFGTGVVVDTMEVAGLWRDLPELYGGVRDALLSAAEAVGCHLSHAYPSGASLYFTFLLRGADDADVERRYDEAWAAAVAVCHEAGATMSHHHGVGRLRSRFMAAELGDEGVAVLRAIKRAADPSMVLNPGSLLP